MDKDKLIELVFEGETPETETQKNEEEQENDAVKVINKTVITESGKRLLLG